MPSPCLIKTGKDSQPSARQKNWQQTLSRHSDAASCYTVTYPLPLRFPGDEASLRMAISEHILSTMLTLGIRERAQH